MDDAAVLEGDVTVGTPVEDDGLEFTVGSAEAADIGVVAGAMTLEVEEGVADDDVVDGSGVVEVLEGVVTGGVVDDTGTFGLLEVEV